MFMIFWAPKGASALPVYIAYKAPSQHPDRIMQEHDLVYFLEGRMGGVSGQHPLSSSQRRRIASARRTPPFQQAALPGRDKHHLYPQFSPPPGIRICRRRSKRERMLPPFPKNLCRNGSQNESPARKMKPSAFFSTLWPRPSLWRPIEGGKAFLPLSTSPA